MEAWPVRGRSCRAHWLLSFGHCATRQTRTYEYLQAYHQLADLATKVR